MAAYDELTAAGVTTRAAATLTGVPRATADRASAARRRPVGTAPDPVAPVTPSNKLSDAERAAVLVVLNSPEFVDRTPVHVYATLLAAGTYLCSISTMYRVLAENAQVNDRRRQARHPARTRPELHATGPGQVFTWSGSRGHRSPRLPQIPA